MLDSAVSLSENDLIRTLCNQLDYLYSEREMTVFSLKVITNSPSGQRGHNLPFLLTKTSIVLPTELSPSNRPAVLQFLTRVVINSQRTLEDLKKVFAKKLEAIKPLGSDGQEVEGLLFILEQVMALESDNYGLGVAATEEAVGRYRVAKTDLGKTDIDTKTLQSWLDMLREIIEGKNRASVKITENQRRQQVLVATSGVEGANYGEVSKTLRKKIEECLNRGRIESRAEVSLSGSF